MSVMYDVCFGKFELLRWWDEIFAFCEPSFSSLRSMNQQNILMHSIHPRVSVCNKLNFCGHYNESFTSRQLSFLQYFPWQSFLHAQNFDLPDCSPVDNFSFKEAWRWRHIHFMINQKSPNKAIKTITRAQCRVSSTASSSPSHIHTYFNAFDILAK